MAAMPLIALHFPSKDNIPVLYIMSILFAALRKKKQSGNAKTAVKSAT
jgi:hypothetical protein